MGKAQRQKGSTKKKRGASRIWTWVVVAALAGAAGYGVSQMSGVAFNEDDIKVVNFQGLNSKQRNQALEACLLYTSPSPRD